MATWRIDTIKGINNRAAEIKFPAGFVRECANFDIDVNGLVRKRLGTTLKLEGVFSALWSDDLRCFAVCNGDLIEIFADYTYAVLKEAIGKINLDFTVAHDAYFFSSSTINGKILADGSVHTIGLPTASNAGLSISETTGGDLLKGRYQIACTFLDNNGFESGTDSARVVTLLEDNASISIDNLPVSVNPDVASIAVYVSTLNGTSLYRHSVVSSETTALAITNVDTAKISLRTQFLSPAPLGHLIRYFYGLLLIAFNGVLFYSKPFMYGHYDLRHYLPFPAKITAVLPCEDGFWICADGLYWISGRAAADFVATKKSNLLIYTGSEQWIESQNLAVQGYGGAAWLAMNQDGVVLLGNGGVFLSITNDFLKIQKFSRCGSALVSRDDVFNYVALPASSVQIVI